MVDSDKKNIGVINSLTEKLDESKYIPNHFRTKKFKNPKKGEQDIILITTDQGSWVALTEEKYSAFIKHDLDTKSLNILEQKGIILTEKNINNIIEDQRKRYAFLNTGASLHIIIPTLRCNGKCIYCHSAVKSSSEKKVDMTPETAKNVVDFAFQTPAKKLTIEFQGGEALLNFDILKLIVLEAKKKALITKKQVFFDLVSNLTEFNDTHLDWLISQNISISTSLDGPKEVHDKNRILENGKPTYDIVSKKIDYLREKGINVGILMVTTRASLNKWKEIIDEYVKKGAKVIQLKYISKLGFAKNKWEQQAYSVDEFIDFWKKSVEYIIQLNKQGIKIRERYVETILLKIFTKFDPNFVDFRSPCGLAIGQIAYDYNGDIYTCDEGRSNDLFKLGNVKENNYSDIATSEKTQQLIASSMNDNLLCDNCAYKPWCGTCVVLNHATEGSIIPKLPTNTHHLLFEMMFDYIFEKILFVEEDRKILLSWIDSLKQQ